MFRKNTNLSFAEKPKPVKGIFSVILACAAWIICIVAVVISYKRNGNAGSVIGACGIMALLSAAMGTGFGIGGVVDGSGGRLISLIGMLGSLLLFGGLVILFAGGF